MQRRCPRISAHPGSASAQTASGGPPELRLATKRSAVGAGGRVCSAARPRPEPALSRRPGRPGSCRPRARLMITSLNIGNKVMEKNGRSSIHFLPRPAPLSTLPLSLKTPPLRASSAPETARSRQMRHCRHAQCLPSGVPRLSSVAPRAKVEGWRGRHTGGPARAELCGCPDPGGRDRTRQFLRDRPQKNHYTIAHISEFHAWALAKPNVAPAAALASQQLPCMHAWSRKRHEERLHPQTGARDTRSTRCDQSLRQGQYT
jgi:hypothetical protein